MAKYKNFRKPHKIKKKTPLVKSQFFVQGVLVFSVLFILLYIFIFSPIYQIKEINISGNEKVLAEEIKGLVSGEIEKKLLFVSTKSIFLANSSKIQDILLEKFPHISKVELKKDYPATLLISIEERKPVAVFSQSAKYFYLDKEGIVYEELKNDTFSEPEIQNLSDPKDLKLGSVVIDKKILESILKIESALKGNFKIITTRINIASGEKIEIRVAEGWTVFLNTEEDMENQALKLIQLLEKEIPPEMRGNLDYIDLRFGNRIYYKYKE